MKPSDGLRNIPPQSVANGFFYVSKISQLNFEAFHCQTVLKIGLKSIVFNFVLEEVDLDNACYGIDWYLDQDLTWFLGFAKIDYVYDTQVLMTKNFGHPAATMAYEIMHQVVMDNFVKIYKRHLERLDQTSMYAAFEKGEAGLIIRKNGFDPDYFFATVSAYYKESMTAERIFRKVADDLYKTP